MNANPSPEPSAPDVQKEAYLLYVASGCVPGRDMENWLAARALLIARQRTGREERVISETFPKLHFPLNANVSHSPFGADMPILSGN